MSYIRSLSNPEGLYAWSTLDGFVDIAEGKKALKRMSLNEWEGVIRKWWREGRYGYPGQVVSFKGASITCTPDWRYALRHTSWGEGQEVIMWEVTLQYIARDILAYPWRRAKARKAAKLAATR